MRPHAERLTRLEQLERSGRIVRMADTQLDDRLAPLMAKAGIPNTPEARAAAVVDLRFDIHQRARQ